MAKKVATQRKLEAIAINRAFHDWARPAVKHLEEAWERTHGPSEGFADLSQAKRMERFQTLAKEESGGTALTVKTREGEVTYHAGVDLGRPMDEFDRPYVLTDEVRLLRGTEQELSREAAKWWPVECLPPFRWLNYGGDDVADLYGFDSSLVSPYGPSGFSSRILARRLWGLLGEMAAGIYGDGWTLLSLLDLDPYTGSGDTDGQRLDTEIAEATGKLVDTLFSDIDAGGTWAWGVGDIDTMTSIPNLYPADHPLLSIPRPKDEEGDSSLSAAEWEHVVGPARGAFFLGDLNPTFALACIALDLAENVQGLDFDGVLRLMVCENPEDLPWDAIPKGAAGYLFTNAASCAIGPREIGAIDHEVIVWAYMRLESIFDQLWERTLEELSRQKDESIRIRRKGERSDHLEKSLASWQKRLRLAFINSFLGKSGVLVGRSKAPGLGYYSDSHSMSQHIKAAAAKRDERAKMLAARSEIAALLNGGEEPGGEPEEDALISELFSSIIDAESQRPEVE